MDKGKGVWRPLQVVHWGEVTGTHTVETIVE